MKKLVLLTLFFYAQSTLAIPKEALKNARSQIQRMLDQKNRSAQFNNPLLLAENQHLKTDKNNRIIKNIAIKNWRKLFNLKQRLNVAITSEKLNEIQDALQRRLETADLKKYHLQARANEFLRTGFKYHEEGLANMHYGKPVYDNEQENVINSALTDQFLNRHRFKPQEIKDIRSIIHDRITISSLPETQTALSRMR